MTSQRQSGVEEGDEGAMGEGVENTENKEEGWGWTAGHRMAMGVLLTLLFVFLLIQYVRRPVRLEDAVQFKEGSFADLETAMDPNTAGVEELGAIPHLGEKMAQAIVDYRELHRDEQGVAFQNLADLGRVHGIGKKTLEALRPYLRFPGDATQPAAGPHGLTEPKTVETQPEGTQEDGTPH